MKKWNLNSWTKYPAKHLPVYEDKKELDLVLSKVSIFLFSLRLVANCSLIILFGKIFPIVELGSLSNVILEPFLTLAKRHDIFSISVNLLNSKGSSIILHK